MLKKKFQRKGGPLCRFVSKVTFGDGCFVWTGAVSDTGYGVFWMDGKTTYAHRAAWIFHNGQIPKDRVVIHTCDNQLCVRPDHLTVGTQLENVADCVAKGRHWSARGPYGRLQRSSGDMLLRVQKGESYASVARSLGCSYQAIQGIVKRNGQSRRVYAGKAGNQ